MTPQSIPRFMRMRMIALVGLVVGSLIAAATPALGIVGSYKGAREQVVADGVREVDIKIVNCVGPCILLWHASGPAQLTLRCLDQTNYTSTGTFPTSMPRIDHPCIVESTLTANGALESSVTWRANSCDAPECGSWPEALVANEPAP